MKALSILQPYAQAIVNGVKGYETRSWKTSYRGPLAIHAGKSGLHVDALPRLLADGGAPGRLFLFEEMPRGAVVAVAHLVEVWPVDELLDAGKISPLELAFGDYSPGRFAWELRGVVRLKRPIPAKGQLGLFNVDVRTPRIE